MKLFRKPRDDRLPSSAAKGINNAYHSKNLSPLQKTAEVFLTNSVFPFSPLKKDQRKPPPISKF